MIDEVKQDGYIILKFDNNKALLNAMQKFGVDNVKEINYSKGYRIKGFGFVIDGKSIENLK